MKLGIVVVYLVSEENEKLIDLHLSQIERHTQAPYFIYASINRLLPRFRPKLEEHPKVKVCQCPTTDLRGREEHSYYLEHLVRNALEDGSSHVVTLHVDSFPVRSDWIEELTGKLSNSCALVSIQPSDSYPMLPSTACMLFSRDFYLKYRPSFIPSREDLSSMEYRSFLEEFGQEIHSGSGYVFQAHLHGLSWHRMLRSNMGGDHSQIGCVYDDLVFHLGAAARPKKVFLGDYQWIIKSKDRDVIGKTLWKISYTLLSQKARAKVLDILPRRVLWFLEPQYRKNFEVYQSVRMQLFENPESYLKFLRTGETP
jgi:hypothetical protein